MSVKQLFFHLLSRFRYTESKKLRNPTNQSIPSPRGEWGGGGHRSVFVKCLEAPGTEMGACPRATLDQMHKGASLEPRGTVHTQAGRIGQGLG